MQTRTLGTGNVGHVPFFVCPVAQPAGMHKSETVAALTRLLPVPVAVSRWHS